MGQIMMSLDMMHVMGFLINFMVLVFALYQFEHIY
jgi:hypothetical protein